MTDGGRDDRAAAAVELLRPLADVPAFVRDRHLTVLASTGLARGLSAAFTPGVNLARFAFLNPDVAERTPDFGDAAGQLAATLRDSLEQHEEDQEFRDLVGELSAQSQTFAERWAHDLREAPRTSPMRFEHPQVGPLTLVYQELLVPDRFDEVLVVWAPATDGRSTDAYARLVDIVRESRA